MNWTELLNAELKFAYASAEKLVGMVDDSALGWKPGTGTNWMTTGQLLRHLTECGGPVFKAFITKDFGMPEGGDMTLPTAEQLPTVQSVAEAKQRLQEDRDGAFEWLGKCKEESLSFDKAPAPWDPRDMILGHRLLQMVDHLNQHKGQLFYYLKLQGKPVNTGDLWGA